jgi:hypothetical protein
LDDFHDVKEDTTTINHSYNPAPQLDESAHKKPQRKRGSKKDLTKLSSIPDTRTLLQDNDGEMEN